MNSGLYIEHISGHTQIQDLGRYGYQRYGVTRSGAMNREALRVANILVGNPQNTACLEFNLLGANFTVTCDSLRMAFVGGDFSISINGKPIKHYLSFRLIKGDKLVIGQASSSIRGYLAVAGGFDTRCSLGSYATHLRSGLGGIKNIPLKSGDSLPTTQKFALVDNEFFVCERDKLAIRNTIRVVLGPQHKDFSKQSIDNFLSEPFVVNNNSDRMGYRLNGTPIKHITDGNIVSDPTIHGSIQIPGDGNPIILMADCPTTGGYPKIATVISSDLGSLAQHPPGAIISFSSISVQESQAIYKERECFLKKLPSLLAPIDAIF